METGIIFDLDGTLWDATEQMLPAWNRVMARYSDREPMTLPELRSYMGKTVEEIAAAALPALPEEQRVEVFNRCSIEELPWLREHPGALYPDVPQVLRTLCKRYPLYIVSNCQDGYIQTFLEVSGLGDCFAGFTCSGMTGHGKVEPQDNRPKARHRAPAVYRRHPGRLQRLPVCGGPLHPRRLRHGAGGP